jgi:peptide/nickel transport system ATP-binding protein
MGPAGNGFVGPDGPGPEAVVLRAEALTRVYGGSRLGSRPAVTAVAGVDVALAAGEIAALVGESGSGKSTVAKLLARLEQPTSGRIFLHGAELRAARGRAMRRYAKRVQLIFQDPFASLNPIHTVRYVLTRSLAIHRPQLRGPAREAALRDLLGQVRLTPVDRFIDAFPHELSGGQRQRVAIARALGAEPDVLLADEPVSMLDVSLRIGVLDLLSELRETMGVAILYITHDIASARYFADRIMVMNAGRIVESGDSESVTQHPTHPYTQLLIDSAPDVERIVRTNGAAA